jgi:hypothetical protein
MAHAGNLVVALLQLLLTRLPMVSTHFQVCAGSATRDGLQHCLGLPCCPVLFTASACMWRDAPSLQVLLWYATLYAIFVWAFGEGSGTWRYMLNWRNAKPAGAFILVPLLVAVLFCVWCALAAAREVMLRRHRRRHQAKQQRQHEHQVTPVVPGHAPDAAV